MVKLLFNKKNISTLSTSVNKGCELQIFNVNINYTTSWLSENYLDGFKMMEEFYNYRLVWEKSFLLSLS